jgi:hypothetical protein
MTTSQSTEGQVKEIIDYLAQFKEQLEFVLSNISERNLSESLKQKLKDMDDSIKSAERNRTEELAQVSNKTSKEDIG